MSGSSSLIDRTQPKQPGSFPLQQEFNPMPIVFDHNQEIPPYPPSNAHFSGRTDILLFNNKKRLGRRRKVLFHNTNDFFKEPDLT